MSESTHDHAPHHPRVVHLQRTHHGMGADVMFRVGQKVCCIAKFSDRAYGGEVFPIMGNVYTVRGIHPDGDAILLEEIRNPPIYPYAVHPYEAFFRASKFRPIVSRSTETGMAILRKIADEASKRVDA